MMVRHVIYAGPSAHEARAIATRWASRGFSVRCYPGAATTTWIVDIAEPI